MSRATRKSPSGVATSDLILSAHVAGNADVFPLILQLHVPRGSTVADVTYGKGIFWQNVDPDDYKVIASDIESTKVDCRKLPMVMKLLIVSYLILPTWKDSIALKNPCWQVRVRMPPFEIHIQTGGNLPQRDRNIMRAGAGYVTFRRAGSISRFAK